jgi:hypothetical protein
VIGPRNLKRPDGILSNRLLHRLTDAHRLQDRRPFVALLWLAGNRWALAASFIHLVRQLLSALLHQLYLVPFCPLPPSGATIPESRKWWLFTNIIDLHIPPSPPLLDT